MKFLRLSGFSFIDQCIRSLRLGISSNGPTPNQESLQFLFILFFQLHKMISHSNSMEGLWFYTRINPPDFPRGIGVRHIKCLRYFSFVVKNSSKIRVQVGMDDENPSEFSHHPTVRFAKPRDPNHWYQTLCRRFDLKGSG